MKKNSYITFTDQFCGAGGSSQGVHEMSKEMSGGIEVKLALNHWKLAIDTHNTNFPDTIHDCTDISACNPRRYPSTDILITSPECTNHSLANGKKSRKAQLEVFGGLDVSPEDERSRATMWDVPRFAEYLDYNGIIVENVVDAKRWVMFDAWLKAMHALGYDHECKYLNSMHFEPCPQSRDRMYVVFWKRGNKRPNLDFNPKAFCKSCGCDRESYQWWKNSEKKSGKYKQQYLYRCSGCNEIVEPYYYAAFNCIDWSVPGSRIGDRKRPLAPTTTARIQYGIDTYSEPLIITSRYTSGISSRVKRAIEPLGTQPGDVSHAILNPFLINIDHQKAKFQYVKDSHEEMRTQTTTQSSGIVVPFIAELNRTGKSRAATEYLSTVLAGGNHHMLIVENYKQSKSKPVNLPLGSQTTTGKHGIVTSESMNAFLGYYYGKSTSSEIQNPIGTMTTRDRAYLINHKPGPVNIDDCFYRMLMPSEIQKAMAFMDDYIVLGTKREQVRQLGNAVTPPVMKFLSKCLVNSLL